MFGVDHPEENRENSLPDVGCVVDTVNSGSPILEEPLSCMFILVPTCSFELLVTNEAKG